MVALIDGVAEGVATRVVVAAGDFREEGVVALIDGVAEGVVGTVKVVVDFC